MKTHEINWSEDTTVDQLLAQRAAATPHAVAIYYHEDDQWNGLSWLDYASEVDKVSKALLSMELKSGEKVALIGRNTLGWFVSDMAIMTAGLVSVPIYETSSSEQIIYILEHSNSSILLVEEARYIERIIPLLHRVPALKAIIVQSGNGDAGAVQTLNWKDFIAVGHGMTQAQLHSHRKIIASGNIASFIYTSGTTGAPKAVMLSHANAVTAAASVHSCLDQEWGESERLSCSYLPLSHVAERVVSLLSPLFDGRSVYIVSDLDRVMDAVQEIHPTIWLGVPRIWEKIYEGVNEHIAGLPSLKRGLVNWALRMGSLYNSKLQKQEAVGTTLRWRHWLARKLVINSLLTSLGLDRVIMSITGGAPTRPEVSIFFTSIGLWLQEVYGQTEGHGTTSLSTRSHYKPGSCGKPFPLIDVKIAQDGEILLRGSNVSPGYYGDQALTDKTIKDGWLQSGDTGYLDKDGHLWVTGRKKDIIITSGGKNITPLKIENALCESELVNYAVVIGDGRKYLTALLDVNCIKAAKLVSKKDSKDPFSDDDEKCIIAALDKHIGSINNALSRVEQIKKYRFVYDELTLESGMLTNTMKLKKQAILARYEDKVIDMY